MLQNPLEIERMKYIHSTDGMNEWDRGISLFFLLFCRRVYKCGCPCKTPCHCKRTRWHLYLGRLHFLQGAPPSLWDTCPYRDADSLREVGGEGCGMRSPSTSILLLLILFSSSCSSFHHYLAGSLFSSPSKRWKNTTQHWHVVLLLFVHARGVWIGKIKVLHIVGLIKILLKRVEEIGRQGEEYW